MSYKIQEKSPSPEGVCRKGAKVLAYMYILFKCRKLCKLKGTPGCAQYNSISFCYPAHYSYRILCLYRNDPGNISRWISVRFRRISMDMTQCL
jgi:hypothetical protein